MKNITSNRQLKNFLVYREGELDRELSTQYTLSDRVDLWLARRKAAVKLQLRMAVYDQLHRTHYRRLRNRLIREKRNREFEASIGLVWPNDRAYN